MKAENKVNSGNSECCKEEKTNEPGICIDWFNLHNSIILELVNLEWKIYFEHPWLELNYMNGL